VALFLTKQNMLTDGIFSISDQKWQILPTLLCCIILGVFSYAVFGRVSTTLDMSFSSVK
jgi:hypothetical protein